MARTIIAQPSAAWITFSRATMAAALGLTAGGLMVPPLDIWIKGCPLTGITMLVTATIILTETLRDRSPEAAIPARRPVAAPQHTSFDVCPRADPRSILRPEATRGHEPQLS